MIKDIKKEKSLIDSNRSVRQNLHNEQIGSWGWFPISDTSEKQRFGKIEEVKNYGSYNVWKIVFEDKSCTFLSDKDLKEDSKLRIIKLNKIKRNEKW